MIISSSKGYKVEGSKSQKLLCPRCNNESNHELYGYAKGPQLGFIWIPQQYRLGARSYYLKCPICDNLTGPVNKDSYI